MEHHHQDHGAGSSEKKVKINKFSFGPNFFHFFFPPAVFAISF
jgi:uncharacterized Zn-finger protein